MSAPGVYTRMAIMRDRLEGAFNAYHSGAYLFLIGHVQAPGRAELDQWGKLLDAAYSDYRAQMNALLKP